MVDMGNPHLVLLGDPVGSEVVVGAGALLEGSVEGGSNVEFVWGGPGPEELTMRVWERGVGETLACGTGTCAAAAAAASWGEAGKRVSVHQPGGTLEVVIGPDGVTLSGPTRRVAAVVVEEAVLAAAVEALA
jgi:diaminopimelate epimerase